MDPGPPPVEGGRSRLFRRLPAAELLRYAGQMKTPGPNPARYGPRGGSARRPGWFRGLPPGVPVGPSAPGGAGGRWPLRGARARRAGAVRARALVVVVAYRRCPRPPGRSARWAFRPARRRGRGAPPGGPAAAWPVPGVGGLGSPPPRSPGRLVVGAALRRSAGGPGGAGAALAGLRASPAPCPSRPGSPSPRPYRAARQRHGPPRLLRPGAAGGGASAAL